MNNIDWTHLFQVLEIMILMITLKENICFQVLRITVLEKWCQIRIKHWANKDESDIELTRILALGLIKLQVISVI